MADTKLSAMTELTTLSATDQIYVTPLVTGTRRDRRMTAANLASGVKLLAGSAGTAAAVGVSIGTTTVGLFSGGSGATEYVGFSANGATLGNWSATGLSVGSASAATAKLLVTITQPTRSDATVSFGDSITGVITIAGTTAQFRSHHLDVALIGSGNVGTFAGSYSTLTTAHSSGSIGHFLAVVGRAFHSGTGTSTIAAGVYGDFRCNVAGGTITNGAALYAEPPVISNGTVTNAYGVWVKSIAPSASGVVTNAYGGLFALPTGAANNNIGVVVGTAPTGPVSAAIYSSGTALFVGGIGVGNSASATTLGTVTKKIEVFDAAGASLGFVPIYDAIT